MKTSEWIRKKDGLWIPHRKRTYFYWFKFLREAELSPDHKVDWSKYEGWGGRETILTEKFDDWWDKRWKRLFAVKNRGDDPEPRPYSMSTTQPKIEAIRIDYLVWLLRDTPPDWRARTEGRDTERKASPRRGSNTLAIARRLVATEKRKATPLSGIDPDNISKNGDTTESIIQSRISRHLRSAKQRLDNVCRGQFP